MNADYEELIEVSEVMAHDNENIKEHADRTMKAFNNICSELKIDQIIKKDLSELLSEEDAEDAWDIILQMIYFHDFGKINPNFQKKIKTNNHSLKGKEFEHAYYGMLLFNSYIISKIGGKSEKFKKIIFALSSLIARHHTPLKSFDEMQVFDAGREEYFKNIKEELKNICKDKKQFMNFEIEQAENYLDILDDLSSEEKRTIFYVYKILYSLLTTSDSLATRYRENISSLKMNKISVEDLEKAEKSLKSILSEKSDKSQISIAREKFSSMAVSRLKEKMKSLDNKIFYLYLPTGGGKTFTSVRLAMEILKARDLNRLFYVFPFVNIIEQNKEELKKVFGSELVSPVYSYSEPKFEGNDFDHNHLLNSEFLNFPVSVISNVNFFNSIIKKSKKTNYRLHNFSNSVVVIDEIQSLDDEEWTLYADMIKAMAEKYNTHFIIMSATLPRLTGLIEKLNMTSSIQSKELISEDEPELKDEFSMFLKRTRIEYSKDVDLSDMKKLKKKLKAELKEKDKILIVVNTVSKSRDIFENLSSESEKLNEEKVEILLLNSTILPTRRRQIINKIKEPGKKILISTQSIEAGVDLSFDFGIREYAPLESILQVAGRVNRHGEQKGSVLEVAKVNDTKSDYSCIYNDIRGKFCNPSDSSWFKEFKELFKSNSTELDLGSKYKKYSDDIIEKITEENKDQIKENQLDSLKLVTTLDFDMLNGKSVIKQYGAVSVFVPIKSLEFSDDNEAKTYKEILDKLDIPSKTEGKKVEYDPWQVLEKYCEKTNLDFDAKKANMKAFSFIFSNHCFSFIGNENRFLSACSQYIKEDMNELPFLVLDKNFDKIYSLKEGFDKKILKEANNAIIY